MTGIHWGFRFFTKNLVFGGREFRYGRGMTGLETTKMTNEGWPDIFYGSSSIYYSFQSWPVCPKRVRYRQTEEKFSTGQLWGSVTFDAREFGEHFIQKFPVKEFTHVMDRRLIEWFMDSDQHDDRVLELPSNWAGMTLRIHEFIRAKRLGVFCIKCNQSHHYSDCTTLDDEQGVGSCYKRLICPNVHLLFKHEFIRMIRSPRRGQSPLVGQMKQAKAEYGYPGAESWWFTEDFGDWRSCGFLNRLAED